MAIADSAAEKGFFWKLDEMGTSSRGETYEGLHFEGWGHWNGRGWLYLREGVTSCERCYPTVQQAQEGVQSLEHTHIWSFARLESCMCKVNQPHHAGTLPLFI